MRYEGKRISHSMADAFMQCRKKFEYAHIKSLKAKGASVGIERGQTGHKFFEGFFLAIKDGADSREAAAKGLEAAQSYNSEYAMALIPVLMHWVGVVWPEYSRQWKILEVEKTYMLNIGDHEFPFTVDLLIDDRGVIKIVDHKFLYDFYSDKVIGILPQMPKYAGALRALGINVQGAVYNLVRTRAVTDTVEKTKIVELYMPEERVRTAVKEQVFIIREASKDFIPIRTPNKMNCDHCAFIDLCTAESRGERIDLLIQHNFEKNDYGYEE